MLNTELVQYLVVELREAMQALASRERADEAALFIDALVRLRAADLADLEDLGEEALVAAAEEALAADRMRLTALASTAIDTDRLVERAERICNGAPGPGDDAGTWCEDLLLAGSILAAAAEDARGDLEARFHYCAAFLDSAPAQFAGAADLVFQRQERGDVGAFDDPAVAAFVLACESLSLYGHRPPEEEPPADLRERLAAILDRVDPDTKLKASRNWTENRAARAVRPAAERVQVLYARPDQDTARGIAGCIQLLLWDQTTDQGVVSPLVIEVLPGARLWERQGEQFANVAWDAVRRAWAAAGNQLPGGRPPHPLLDHRLRLGGTAVVDGDSLALPISLAFLSLWTGYVLPDGTAATGGLGPGGHVDRVGGIDRKCAAWVQSLGNLPGLLLVPAGQERRSGPEIGVAHLVDALRLVNLDPKACSMEQAGGDESERLRALRSWVTDVQEQQLADHQVHGVDPWGVLATRLTHVLESLPPEGPHREDVARARASAATAWLHAGQPEESNRVLYPLGGDEPPAWLPHALRLLVRTARLNARIDEHGEDDEEVFAGLEQELAASDATDVETQSATLQALGTMGRYRLHRREHDAAVALLERAADKAREHDEKELPRCLNYLAMAHRSRGELDKAHRLANHAFTELDRVTRKACSSYYYQTRTFLRYELARIRLDQEAAADAEQIARLALDELSPPGPWPQIGILRTLAWALRAQGRVIEAEHAVEQLRGLMPAPGRGADALFRIESEAMGSWTRDGEVY